MLVRKDSARRKRPAAFVCLFLLALISSKESAEAQEDKAFYAGKAIQLLVASGPGGTTDVSARLVGRYLGKHIPGNPGVVVQNMSGGGGLVAANYLFNVAKPDGLTIAAISRANYIEQMVGRPEVKADFRKFNWIGSFNKAPMMVACRSDTEYKSIAAIRAAKTPPRFGQSGTGSISYVFANLIERILDLKIRNVTGFQSGRETDLGMERGEVDCRATSDITVIRAPWNHWVKENYVTFVVQQGPEKSVLLPPVPTVAELARPEAKPYLTLMNVMLAYTEFDRPFAAPPGMPKERVQILRDSFERMLKDGEFATEAKKLLDWDGTTYLSGEQLQKKMISTITQPPEVIKRIKEILAES
ncbi:MAG TPA: tripartite tricarboxylate transporter substrate-binding protein [Candidatus Binatia bacterium]|jgi:tripartite-type tricarboxylate transporter receptor subunit TctC|nr:tripartite tricarboxylate transporter substrate-binding protein [Candidatus Binatia bacterium]